MMKLFKFNPMLFNSFPVTVTCYRWGEPWLTAALGNWGIYFWGVIDCAFALGTLIFKRLKPHFADVIIAVYEGEMECQK